MKYMIGDKYTFFIRSIRGKIIIASVLACFTLLLAWGVSKVAFKRMLTAVETISAPNDKLRLVNELTHKVAQLDQLQKSEILNNPANYYSVFRGTKKLLLTIDTLKTLFADNPKQIKHLNSLKKLLTDRDKLFINYLKVREGLVNNKNFSNQVKTLNELVSKSARQNDSTVTTTEKTLTTTIVPISGTDSAKDSRGFFSKLFGKKKEKQQEPMHVTNVEINTRHDTLAVAKQDSIIKGMNRTMRKLETTQLKRSALFINKEASLNKANNKLIKRILAILKQVEAEAFTRTAWNNTAAKNVVKSSVSLISYLILAFFVLTITMLYFILRDIRSINQYRKELEVARDEAEYHGQAKQRFLSNMSHEIRTPLQSIMGYAELMKQQANPRKRDIDAIYRSSEHLMQIVNEVLDYNRIISGKFTINPQAFNMADLLNEVESAMRLHAVKKSVKLISDHQIPADTYVEGDAFRLKQILYNLLGNAIKFTEKGEVKLSVSFTKTNDALNYVFTVSDTGIGLSNKDVNRIFEEFEQVPEPGSNYLKGTGLGLTISKALIEAQGGSINVKSVLGSGSSFTFNIGYKTAIVPAAETGRQLDKLAGHYDGKVWVLDDDNFILDLCSSIFERNGVQHRCFNAPMDLLNTAFDPAVKYIFLDIRMPEVSGIEICRILRESIPADVKIYALTAQALPGESDTILNQGFNGLLMKPFKERELLGLVTQPDDNKRTPEVKLDISRVEKMTFGDKRQLNKILKRFTEDCIDDIAELRLSMENHDNDKLILLVHRIAGRTAQIGDGALAADFRQAEMDLVNNSLEGNEKKEMIITLTTKLQALVKQVRRIYLDDNVPETTV